VRGYHPLLAFGAGTGDLLGARLGGGNANTARGAAGFITETINRVRAAGATGPICLRADSGFYAHQVVKVCQQAGCATRSPPSATGDPADPDDAWVPIGYWLEGGADVAETSYRPFGKRGPAVRLIVRRVRPPRARSWRWT
jgi:Transposase DDE domain group 1